jgi:hypothetical protein
MTHSSGLDRTSSRTEGVEAHDTAEGLVLYAVRDDTVHQLNAMTTLLYELSDGRTLASIARSFAVIFAVDTSKAESLASSSFEQLRDLGLVE